MTRRDRWKSCSERSERDEEDGGEAHRDEREWYTERLGEGDFILVLVLDLWDFISEACPASKQAPMI